METGIWPFAPLTYQGLVKFLVLLEDALDNLGDDPLKRHNATDQLIYDLLVELAEHKNLLNNLEDWDQWCSIK